MKRKLLSVLLSSAALSSMLVGCQGSDTSTQEGTDTIVYSMTTAPSGVFNPLISDTMYDEKINSVVYTSLMTVNNEGELEEYLATSQEVSDDEKTITYKIQENATWHDGEKVTAEDVEFTFTSMADANYTGGRYSDVQNIKGASEYHEGKADTVEGIKVIDDTTIEIEFEEVSSPAVTNIGTTGIIPEHIWGEVDVAEWDTQTEKLNAPIGCGPFKLTEYENGQFVKFESNKEFFAGEPKTANLVYKVVNADTVQSEFKNGSIDIADVSDLSAADVKAMVDENNLGEASYPNFMYQYMGFNLREEKFQDVKVRQAFMYAIDREAMVEKLLEGRGEITNAPILPTSWAYPSESKELNEYKYNVETAKALLKEAGWEDRDNDGIVENEAGEKMEIELICPTGSTKREQAAVVIQEYLKQIGVAVEINSMEFSAVMEQVVANHEFDIYLMGNTLSLDPDPTPYWHSSAISHEKGVQGYNIVGYYNEETDKLIEKAVATVNQDEREKIYAEYAKILNEDVAQTYLYCQNIDKIYDGNLEGYKPSTFNEFYNVHNWVIK